MELIEKLGIDGKIILAQIVNFFLLLIVLYKFLYHPLLSVLEKRRKKIAESLKGAEELAEKTAQADLEMEKRILKAKKEAAASREIFQKEAEEERLKTKEQLLRQLEELKEKARKEIAQEKEALVLSAKKEIADLSVMLAGKILKQSISSEGEAAAIGELEDLLRKGNTKNNGLGS
jgi:F-type H+-transporting ATPase subunit b